MIELINESLKPVIEYVWGSVLVWRTLALFLLVPTVAVFLKRDWVMRFLLSPETREHDRHIFTRADQLLPEPELYQMLDRLGGDHAYFQSERMRVSEFVHFFEHVGNWYMTRRMAGVTKELLKSLQSYLQFKSVHFFRHPQHQTGDDVRLVLEPALNIDREGSGDPEQMEKYFHYAEILRQHLDDIEEKYKQYRLAAKRGLGL